MKHYFEFLENQLVAAWNRPLLSDYRSSSFTGRDIAANIAGLQDLFEKAGLAKGDRIAIYGGNSARWGMAFLAANTWPTVAVPLLADFRPTDAASLVRHSEAGALFVNSSVWKQMKSEEIPSIRLVISLEDYSVLDSRDADLKFEPHDGMMPQALHFPKCDGGKIAVINYTSGTTSAPKGVMLTYDNFSTNVLFALEHIPPHAGDTIVSMLPMAHMYGFMFEFLYPLCGGVHVHFLGKAPTPAMLSEALGNVRPYILITVPLVMEKIVKGKVMPVVSKPLMKVLLAMPGLSSFIRTRIRNKLMAAFGGNITEIVMGGAALNPDVEKWMKRLKLPYTVGYGMTEAAPLIAYEWWESYAKGSCGKAVDRSEVRIDSEDPQHVAGEIQARGVNIMKGYYKNDAATEQAFTEDGWLRTGDLGVIDADGNIFIRGRSKNMLLSSNGQNIYPEEIEAIVNTMPYIQESVVVSREHRLTALVYTGGNDFVLSGNDLVEYVASTLKKINLHLPSYSRLASLEIVPNPFEKTPKQSIKRFLYH